MRSSKEEDEEAAHWEGQFREFELHVVCPEVFLKAMRLILGLMLSVV